MSEHTPPSDTPPHNPPSHTPQTAAANSTAEPFSRATVLWTMLLVGLLLQGIFGWIAYQAWPGTEITEGECSYSYMSGEVCSDDQVEDTGDAGGVAVALGVAGIGGIMVAISIVGFGVSLGMAAHTERITLDTATANLRRTER